MISSDIKCTILKYTSELSSNLQPVAVKTLEEIKQHFNIEDNVYSFMQKEISDYGRFWIDDNTLIRRKKNNDERSKSKTEMD